MEFKYTFSVFTPAYNAEKTLHRVFESLMAQSFRDFEWIIVDDGSNDGTQEAVEAFNSQAGVDFPIRYIWQENQHKKVAHNRAAQEAQGEFFLPADSDDRFPAEALQHFFDYWKSIPEDRRGKFAGVTGLCQYEDGRIVGDNFPAGEWIDSNPQVMQYRYKVKGEKWGFTKTQLLRYNQYPEGIPGYVPEGVVWNAIGAQYWTRYVNIPVRIYFQESQTEKKGKLLRAKDPGRLLRKQQILGNDIGWFRWAPLWFFLEGMRLSRFYFHCSPESNIKLWPNSWGGCALVLVTLPLGFVWFLSDQLRLARPSSQKGHSKD